MSNKGEIRIPRVSFPDNDKTRRTAVPFCLPVDLFPGDQRSAGIVFKSTVTDVDFGVTDVKFVILICSAFT